MANLSNTTKDHEEIRRWAEERGGKPSHVKSTGSKRRHWNFAPRLSGLQWAGKSGADQLGGVVREIRRSGPGAYLPGGDGGGRTEQLQQDRELRDCGRERGRQQARGSQEVELQEGFQEEFQESRQKEFEEDVQENFQESLEKSLEESQFRERAPLCRNKEEVLKRGEEDFFAQP